MPLVKVTYHCRVIRLTNTKHVALQQEYDNLQHYPQTREDGGLYSANRQQADRFYKAIEKTPKPHVRGWYFIWLRRQLGLKKAIYTIKKIGDHEKRIANDIIHKITRENVNRAIETDSLIVLSKLKGLRNREKKDGRGRGMKFNRKLSGFPYFTFTYLTYNASAGIKVIKIFEYWTSQTCRICNQGSVERYCLGYFQNLHQNRSKG
jgi:IS605 OrfB family transposase